MTFHDLALTQAERFNPGGQHIVQSVEFDGQPDPDNPDKPYIDVHIVVATRLPAALTDINLTVNVGK